MMLMVEGGVWRIWFYVQHVVGYLKCVCVFRVSRVGGGGGQ